MTRQPSRVQLRLPLALGRPRSAGLEFLRAAGLELPRAVWLVHHPHEAWMERPR